MLSGPCTKTILGPIAESGAVDKKAQNITSKYVIGPQLIIILVAFDDVISIGIK